MYFIMSFCLIALLLAVNANNFTNSDIENELRMTQKEKLAFEELKSALFNKITEKELALMKTDLYFLRFIRAKNLDVELAKRDLTAFLNFIRVSYLLKYLKLNWLDIEEDFPIKFNAEDRRGNPILFISTTYGWNTRQAEIDGKSTRLHNYLYKLVLEVIERLTKIAREDPSVTQVTILIDLKDFNIYNSGCPLCIIQYIELLNLFERWIPGYVNAFIMINAQPNVSVVIGAARVYLSSNAKKALKIFGSGDDWKQYLEETIDKKQLHYLLGDY